MNEKIKQLFCIHKYEISIIVGVGFTTRLSPNKVDAAEISCYCSKCKKSLLLLM